MRNPIVPLYDTGGRRRKYERGVSTYISEGPRYITVRYHHTDIVTIDKEDRLVILNSGGYRTLTTKRRINQVLKEFIPSGRYSIFQFKYDWYVFDKYGGYFDKIPFEDGMELDIDVG